MTRFFLACCPWIQETSILVLWYLLLASPAVLKTPENNLQLRKPPRRMMGWKLCSLSLTGWRFGRQSGDLLLPGKEVTSPLAIFSKAESSKLFWFPELPCQKVPGRAAANVSFYSFKATSPGTPKTLGRYRQGNKPQAFFFFFSHRRSHLWHYFSQIRSPSFLLHLQGSSRSSPKFQFNPSCNSPSISNRWCNKLQKPKAQNKPPSGFEEIVVWPKDLGGDQVPRLLVLLDPETMGTITNEELLSINVLLKQIAKHNIKSRQNKQDDTQISCKLPGAP